MVWLNVWGELEGDAAGRKGPGSKVCFSPRGARDQKGPAFLGDVQAGAAPTHLYISSTEANAWQLGGTQMNESRRHE